VTFIQPLTYSHSAAMKRRVFVLLVILAALIVPGALGQAQVQVQPPEVFVVEGA
jgi:hypothetical protein